MTLPKNITDAIDTLLQSALKTLTSAYAMPADEYLRICTGPDRAALEAAIAAAIQPVERGEFERQASAWLDFAHTTMPALLLRLGASHRRRDRAARSHVGGDPMTLPKNITDAIDKYAMAIAGACANFDDGTPNICRAALEAAIAKEIQPVEPPTDAEAMSTDDTMRRIEESLNTYATLCYLHAGPAKTREARDDVVATIRAALQPDAGGWGEDDDRHRANEEHERAVEAWAARFGSAMLSYSHDWGLPDEEAYKPFGVAENHAAIRALLNDGVRLMRRQPKETT